MEHTKNGALLPLEGGERRRCSGKGFLLPRERFGAYPAMRPMKESKSPPARTEPICPATLAPAACMRRWFPRSYSCPILCTTRDNAELMGMSDRVGTIEAGKCADFILVDGDPLKDVRIFQNREKILAIVQDGKFIKKTL